MINAHQKWRALFVKMYQKKKSNTKLRRKME